MSDDSITKEELLFHMLQEGWEWVVQDGQQNNEKPLCILKYKEFKFYTHTDVNVFNLIDAQVQAAYFRGKSEQ